jgi:HEAT repeat protein
MSREQLLGLADDTDKLLAAGVASGGGAALSRRGKTLGELAKKVPALGPVADAVGRVAGADRPAAAFLDLLVMTRQVRGGLAAPGVDGPLTPLPQSGPWQSPLPGSEIRWVYEALTQPGSANHSCVGAAGKRKLFGDLRLLSAMIRALGGGAGDLVAKEGLPAVGAGAVDELRAGLDLNGKEADARRLRAICSIDREAGAGLCRQALAGGNPTLRAEALYRLPEVAGADEVEEAALKYCRDRSNDVWRTAVGFLGKSKNERALIGLLELLGEKDWSRARSAADGLGSIRCRGAAASLLAELQQALAHLEGSGSKKAKGGHGTGGKAGAARGNREAIEARAEWLVKALGRRKDVDRRALARAVLPLIGRAPGLSKEAGFALRSVGPAAEEIIPTLLPFLEKNDEYAYHALAALEGFPPAARSAAVAAAARVVEDGKRDEVIRIQSLGFLAAHVEGHRGPVLRAARAALADRKLLTCFGLGDVFEPIGEMGPAAEELLPDIFSVFRNAGRGHDVLGLSQARKAVVRLDPGGKGAVPELVKLLGDKNRRARSLALDTLREYGTKARQAIPAVRQLAAGRDPATRSEAEKTLKAIR